MHAHKQSMHKVLTCLHVLDSVQHINLPNPPHFFCLAGVFRNQAQKKWASRPPHPFRLWKRLIFVSASQSAPLFQQPFSGEASCFYGPQTVPRLPPHLQPKSQPSPFVNNLGLQVRRVCLVEGFLPHSLFALAAAG